MPQEKGVLQIISISFQFSTEFIKYCCFSAVIKSGGNQKMAVVNLTKENFEKEVLNSKKPVIIDFYADWCGPCRMLKPVFEKASEEFKDKLLFKRLNTEDEEVIAMNFGIQGIPSLVVVHNKKEVGRIVGYMGEDALKSRISEILSKNLK